MAQEAVKLEAGARGSSTSAQDHIAFEDARTKLEIQVAQQAIPAKDSPINVMRLRTEAQRVRDAEATQRSVLAARASGVEEARSSVEEMPG